MEKHMAYYLKDTEMEEALRDFLSKHGEAGRLKGLNYWPDELEDRDGEWYVLFSDKKPKKDAL